MKTKNAKVLLSAAIVLLMAWAFAACSKKDDVTPVVVDKTALETSLDTANHYLTVAVEGNAAGQYQVGSKTTLQAAVTAAQSVHDNSTSTQAQIGAATASLDAAVQAFKLLIIAPIQPGDLIAYYKFDDGGGNSVADASANHFTGTLYAAHSSVGTGGVPNWVVDRKGATAKALHFADGGHIEVPKNTAFNPAAITISLWANLDSLNTANGIYSNNYILSQNDYHGYKFQTQEAKKPFFTQATTTGIFDRDTNNGLAGNNVIKLKKWYHLAVTYSAGTEVFYVNGQPVFTWTDVTGTMLTLSDLEDFCIGVSYSNAYWNANPPNYVPPHFYGSLDEVRLYKTALSATQIQGIYNQEK